ncbi:hypothetical protein B7P43_G02923 [Cryptotermes secundus]|uniref:Uncharacterized protein n=2 Tax=Cryptotermes secundus TaxID=105785 RepID=A0A2J7Q162_9NEOP|nr:breast carcinoma-amplified sequence 3 homolog isoform X2 [Cryptotermes secundus]XP_023718629.1 breast carcinoma-amplified sequence 3 homolog isoform X2 [Cryptotermes secundus]XP_023718630.1 breast carcinoma-amplified sequence 3 homolog isoform X2 [Cryptotermes secundus]PNF22320.1 hypothetical protein B7P43_G02923 [Cryptotermes secundus]
MSAESPRKSSRQGGHIVAPQSVSDRSIIDSVAGFINEVVPQAYTSAPVGEGKEAITWARFEYGDINDPALYPDSADDRNSSPPLLLVLGYGSGVQVWAIPASGEATEVLSWRQGVVRTLRILPTPGSDACTPDTFSHKRPLVAMCDSAGGPSPQFCSLSFISLRGGDQVKSIKFKNPVSDVLANRRSVVVTFPERIAVFDASTLEDRLTVTTCYPCPGPNPNPVALGSRWLAYSERRLMPARRSSGGTEGDGVQSYTATVLHAAKSFGKGLRELGETVASSLTGGGAGMGLQRGMVGGIGGPVAGQQGGNMLSGNADIIQPGVVTILDAQGALTSRREEESRSGDSLIGGSTSSDNIIAHFMAHSEPIVALAFDPSGMLLLTADKRGHDFHVFRIHPHPGGPFLAAIHHLYILHRGDTTAKVQDIAFAADSRWVAVSTLRGTTHVFPITPYGGPVGIRTHATPHVVNRLSRFHRSAGLTADGRNSPIPTPVSEAVSTPPPIPYPNPRLPPYSHPTVISPLAQIRQPTTHTLLSTPTSINPTSHQPYHRNPSMRSLGRTQSSSDDGLPGGGIPLRVTACFAPPRAWLIESPTLPRETSAKAHKRAVDSLFVMACHGNLIEYDLQPRHAAGIPKEKVCDDTAIELDVRPKAQWMLLRPPHSSELQPPLSPTNPLMVVPDRLPTPSSCESREDDSDSDERWLSQVEIVTHAGPHRRLWMGPQFTFKTYNSAVSGVPLSLLELEAVEVGVGSGSRPARSNPVNMPISSGSRPVVPVLIESGSGSSYEQSPRLLEAYGTDGAESDGSAGPGETQLREDLADAMMESPGIPTHDTGRRVIVEMQHGAQLGKRSSNPIQKVVNPVGTVITVSVPSEEAAASLASDLTMTTPSKCESSAEEESGVKPLHGCSRQDPPSLDDTVRWPAVSKPTCFSQCKGYEPSASESKEAEFRTEKKGKENTRSASSKRYSNKLQDERKDDSKWPKEEGKKEHNVTVGETEHKEMTVPSRTLTLENGLFALSASVWEKRRAQGIDSQFKPQNSLPAKTSDTQVEDVGGKSNKEAQVKVVKSKLQAPSKIKDGNNASCKPKSFLAKGIFTDDPSGQGSLKRGKMCRSDEDTFCERTFNLDEVRHSETKCSKQNTKKKESSITSGSAESMKLSTGDKHHKYHEGERKDESISVSQAMLMDLVSTSDALGTENDKGRTPKLVEFDDLCPSGAHGVIKKTNEKRKDSRSLLIEDNELIAIPDSGDNRNSDKLGNLLVSVPKIEPLKLCSLLLHERLNEHHFGTGKNTSHDAVRNSNFESLSKKSEEGTQSSQFVQPITEGRTSSQTREVSEKKFCGGSTELETDNDQSRQKHPMFRSTLDDVFASPVLSWSSIVSSSNINKYPVKEVVVPPSSETVLLNLEESRISPQRSWSDVAKVFPDHSQTEEISDRDICSGFATLKGPEDVDDYSDEGEDKMAVDSRKSQSSDQNCKVAITSESLRTAAISETNDATAGIEEDCSQLNEENNGNDDELADNGEATNITALQGANKKSRRLKKKRR